MVYTNAQHLFSLGLLDEKYQENWYLDECRRTFSRQDFVYLPGLIAPGPFAVIKNEMEILTRGASVKKFHMPGPETPRAMSTVGGVTIFEASGTAWALYSHQALRSMIKHIVDGQVFDCKHIRELFVCNILTENGSTYGWHLDDSTYALILMLEATHPSEGGSVQIIQNWTNQCEKWNIDPDSKVSDDLIERFENHALVQTVHLKAGDGYLLRADKCLHRVKPLVKPGICRIALNMAYEATLQPKYSETTNLLYDGL